MAVCALDYKNYVLYVCSCSQKVAIDDLYFCHHCKSQRCDDCVSTVIDNSCVSCPHCFEAVPQADTRNRKNKCNHCFQCPLCGSTLTSRFVVVASEVVEHTLAEKSTTDGDGEKDKTPSPEKRKSIAVSSPNTTPQKSSKQMRSSFSGSSLKSPGTKFYYLSCTHCRWSTRDVKISDKRSPLDFKERSHLYQERFTELISYYKALDSFDRSVREQTRKQQSGRKTRNYSGLLDTTKFKKELSPRHIANPTFAEKGFLSVATDPEPLPDDFYTLPVSMETVTTMTQRFRDPIRQPASIEELWPRPLSLIGKKLHRCRGCDHILLKADVNLNSIRFKIHQLALFTVPRIRVVHLPKLSLQDPAIVPVSFTNPLNYPLKISFGPYPNMKRLKEKICFPVIPDGEFILSDNETIDDVIDNDSTPVDDDNTFVLSREPGRLVLKFGILAESFAVDSKIAFVLRFSYKPAIESEEDILEIPVLMNCGRTSI